MSARVTDWLEATTEQLRVLWAEGLSTAEIGRRMGISKSAVCGKAHRLELPGRPSPIKSGPRAPRKSRAGARPRVTLPGLALSPRKQGFNAIARSLPVAHFEPEPVVFTHAVEPCRWPIGTPRTPTFRFCSEPTTGQHRTPYCCAHLRKAYIQSAPQVADAA